MRRLPRSARDLHIQKQPSQPVLPAQGQPCHRATHLPGVPAHTALAPAAGSAASPGSGADCPTWQRQGLPAQPGHAQASSASAGATGGWERPRTKAGAATPRWRLVKPTFSTTPPAAARETGEDMAVGSATHPRVGWPRQGPLARWVRVPRTLLPAAGQETWSHRPLCLPLELPACLQIPPCTLPPCLSGTLPPQPWPPFPPGAPPAVSPLGALLSPGHPRTVPSPHGTGGVRLKPSPTSQGQMLQTPRGARHWGALPPGHGALTLSRQQPRAPWPL